MKFNEFVKIYKDTPLIDASTFALYSKDSRHLRRQVREWVEKEYLLPLKKGLYLFSPVYRKIELSPLFIANFLFSPSYLSMEYALGFYDLIPERVTVFTSATTKKTSIFENILGRFEYRTLKKDLFFGFKKGVDTGQEFFIALPEKTLLDYFYLNPQLKGSFSELESLRLQNLEILNLKTLQSYSLMFNHRVKRVANVLIQYTKEHRRNYQTM